MEGMIQLVFLIGFIAMGVFFLYTQQKAFEAIAEENRLMQPGNVWMQLIPIYNLYWYFVVVNKLSQSIGAEYSRLSIDKNEQNPTQNMGIATGVIYFFTIIPDDTIKGFASLVWFVCFVIYWVQIFRCKNKIIANIGNDLLDIERELLEKSNS